MRRTNTWCLALGLLFLIFSSYLVSGIQISEVNPLGAEFVEIYNEDNELLNLSEWRIKDQSANNPDEITCEGISACSLETDSRYFIIIGKGISIEDVTHQSVVYFYVDDQKIGNGLNNDKDEITFYKDNFLDSFYYDSIEEGKTWQLCGGNWNFSEMTPGKENLCEYWGGDGGNSGEEEEEDVSLDQNSTDKEDNDTILISTTEIVDEKPVEEAEGYEDGENKTIEMIYLGKTIKKDEGNIYKSKTRYIREYGIYGFALFCIFIIIFLILKKT